MAGRTHNLHLDSMANEIMLFTDYYAEAGCTAGRANFISLVIMPGALDKLNDVYW
jgi:hypothetical protein